MWLDLPFIVKYQTNRRMLYSVDLLELFRKEMQEFFEICIRFPIWKIKNTLEIFFIILQLQLKLLCYKLRNIDKRQTLCCVLTNPMGKGDAFSSVLFFYGGHYFCMAAFLWRILKSFILSLSFNNHYKKRFKKISCWEVKPFF